MKKKWPGIMALLLALLVLVSTAVPTVAQSAEEETAGPEPVRREALAIVAPWGALVGEEVSMSVFQRRTQEPVEGAGIWALTRGEAEVLKEQLAEARGKNGVAAGEQDYESLVSIHGTFLGRTDGNGRLKYTFAEEGEYVLVAVKQGYFPGFAPLRIRTIPKALSIEAPRSAEVGEEVTMTVYQRGTEDPVKDAGIWALTREQAEELKAELDALREASGDTRSEVDWESVVSIRGVFLGTTNGSGQLKHAFDEEGGYLLVAVKQGYFPGFSFIGIRAPQSTIALDSQGATY